MLGASTPATMIDLQVHKRRAPGTCLAKGPVFVVAVASCDDERATHAHVSLVDEASSRPFAEKRAPFVAQTTSPLHALPGVAPVKVATVEFAHDLVAVSERHLKEKERQLREEVERLERALQMKS